MTILKWQWGNDFGEGSCSYQLSAISHLRRAGEIDAMKKWAF